MTLEELGKAIEDLRLKALFGGDDDAVPKSHGTLDPFAEFEYLICLALLDQAHHAAQKAHIHQARGVVDSQRRGLL